MQVTDIHSKSFTELVETLDQFSEEELSIFPKNLISNFKKNKDPNYIWEFDKSKKVKDQNYMTETKALIVNLYKKYLCPESEKEKWKKYDSICDSLIEEEKRNKYNPDKIFTPRLENIISTENVDNSSENVSLTKVKEESILKKIFGKIISFFKKKN